LIHKLGIKFAALVELSEKRNGLVDITNPNVELILGLLRIALLIIPQTKC